MDREVVEFNTQENLKRAEQEVLKVLAEPGATYSPKQLVERLGHEGFSEEGVRGAMWQLIGRYRIQLGPNWKIYPYGVTQPPRLKSMTSARRARFAPG